VNFLIPNKYNWTIDPGEIIYNSKSVISEMWTPPIDYFEKSNQDIEKLKWEAYENINFFFKKHDQILCSTNLPIAENDYGNLFNELFKPADRLSRLLNENLEKINGEFIAVTLRFQQLLGDFIEGDYPILKKEERPELIYRCIEHIKDIYYGNDCKKVLVTSDSMSFLEEARKIDFIYVIPGRLAHIDWSLDKSVEIYMKSFLDYFALMNARKIYLIIDDKMMNSGFSYRAALHNNIPYETRRYIIH
jgi:hypothetical protein